MSLMMNPMVMYDMLLIDERYQFHSFFQFFHPGLRLFIQEAWYHRLLQHTPVMQIKDQGKVRQGEFAEVKEMKLFSGTIQVIDQPVEAFEVDRILREAAAPVNANSDVEGLTRRETMFAMEQIETFHELRTLDKRMHGDHATRQRSHARWHKPAGQMLGQHGKPFL